MSSQELVQKCPCIQGSNWNLEILVFEERGKSEYPKKNLSGQGREPTTNSTHTGIEPGTPMRHPCSPIALEFLCFTFF